MKEKKYSKKLIQDYILGNDIIDYDIDDLENDPEFMMEVFFETKDKNMYDLCHENLKTDINFVKFIIDNFKEDKVFLLDAIETYINATNTSNEEREIINYALKSLKNNYDLVKELGNYYINNCEIDEISLDKNIVFTIINSIKEEEFLKEFIYKYIDHKDILIEMIKDNKDVKQNQKYISEMMTSNKELEELLIILSKKTISKKTHDELINLIVNHITNIIISVEKINNNSLGFKYIKETMFDETIKTEIAKKLLDKNFYENKFYNLEEIIHMKYKNKEDLEKDGIENFILSYISTQDASLMNYVQKNKNLIEKYKEEILTYLEEEKWNKYKNELFTKRIRFLDYIGTEVWSIINDKLGCEYNHDIIVNEILKNIGLEKESQQFKTIEFDEDSLIIDDKNKMKEIHEEMKNQYFIEYKTKVNFTEGDILLYSYLKKIIEDLYKYDVFNQELIKNYEEKIEVSIENQLENIKNKSKRKK